MIDETPNTLVLPKNLVGLNSKKEYLFLPIKMGIFYFHILVKSKEELQELISFSNKKNIYETMNDLVPIFKKYNSFFFFDYEYNYVRFYNKETDDFKRFLHPRERKRRLDNLIFNEINLFRLKNQIILPDFKLRVLLSPSFQRYKAEYESKSSDIKYFYESDIINYLNKNSSIVSKLNYEDLAENIRDREEIYRTKKFSDSLIDLTKSTQRYKRLIDEFGQAIVIRRLTDELFIICQDRYQEYLNHFLRLKMILDKNKIPFIVKGSAVWSLFLYVLGLSHVNPLKYNIPFERFLGEWKIADIDIDIPSSKRMLVLEQYQEILKSRNKSFYQILNKISANNWKYACHPTWFLIEDIDYLSTKLPLISWEFSYDYDKFTNNIKEDKTLYFWTSLLYDSSILPSLEKLWYLKYDLIRSQILETFISYEERLKEKGWTVKQILENWESFRLPENYIYNELRKWTYFQLKSSWALRLVNIIKPKSYLDITKLMALNRSSILRLFSYDDIEKKIRFGYRELWDSKIDEIIKSSWTWFLLLYQDQVIFLIQEVLEDIDFHTVLNLVKWRDQTLWNYKSLFVTKLKKRVWNIHDSVIEELWSMIEWFGQYGLNKWHSYSYALVIYVELIINYILNS